jgi:hypothetical protein
MQHPGRIKFWSTWIMFTDDPGGFKIPFSVLTEEALINLTEKWAGTQRLWQKHPQWF